MKAQLQTRQNHSHLVHHGTQNETLQHNVTDVEEHAQVIFLEEQFNMERLTQTQYIENNRQTQNVI